MAWNTSWIRSFPIDLASDLDKTVETDTDVPISSDQDDDEADDLTELSTCILDTNVRTCNVIGLLSL